MRLNLDAGERDDESQELWEVFDLLNAACGGHAGDATSMARISAFCAAHPSIQLGAHPAYPDRARFGRVTVDIAPAALADTIEAQCTALADAARAHGIEVVAVKAHGALYHDAARSAPLADAVIRGALAALGPAILVIGPPGGALREAARAHGLSYAREGFADRRMRADGSLVPRTEPDALLLAPADAAAQARELRERVDTICVHADTPGALAIARAVREAVDG